MWFLPSSMTITCHWFCGLKLKYFLKGVQTIRDDHQFNECRPSKSHLVVDGFRLGRATFDRSPGNPSRCPITDILADYHFRYYRIILEIALRDKAIYLGLIFRSTETRIADDVWHYFYSFLGNNAVCVCEGLSEHVRLVRTRRQKGFVRGNRTNASDVTVSESREPRRCTLYKTRVLTPAPVLPMWNTARGRRQGERERGEPSQLNSGYIARCC